MYVDDPVQTTLALSERLRPGGVLVCIEPFAADGDPEALERIRQHTQSRHGGFTREQMSSFAAGLELVELHNCYWAAPLALVEELWQHMSTTGNWGLLNRAFAMAALDLRDESTTSRRDATGIKLVARKR
jgi:CheY-like chemotaxis protein